MIEIRRQGRYFGLYRDGALLALVCYRVGAIALRDTIEQLEAEITTLRQGIQINGTSPTVPVLP